MLQRQVTILIMIIYLALAACMESQTTSAPLSKPTVYEWIGPDPSPSLQRLAQDKSTCFHESERTDTQKAPGVVSGHWKAHLKLCMQKQGWGEKPVD
jgi:hypothetical protein